MGLGESKMRIDTLVSRARAVVAAAIIGLSASSFAAAGTDLSAVTVAKLVDPDRIVAMLADVDGGGIPVIVEFATARAPRRREFCERLGRRWPPRRPRYTSFRTRFSAGSLRFGAGSIRHSRPA